MTVHIGRLMMLILSAVSFIIVSCEDRNPLQTPSEEGRGKVMLSLYSDIEVKSPQAVSETDDYNFRFVGVGSYVRRHITGMAMSAGRWTGISAFSAFRLKAVLWMRLNSGMES